MRKRILLPILFVMLTTTLVACKDKDTKEQDDRITISTDVVTDDTSEGVTEQKKTTEDITYEVKKEYYKKDNISIEYPVLEGNIPDIEAVNQFIYDENMSGIEYLTDSYTYTQTMEIKEQSNEVLSVLFQAYNMYSTASHPVALFNTINIDVKTGKRIEFEKEQFEEFSSKVKNKEFEIIGLIEGIEVEQAKDEIISRFSLSSGYPMFYIQDGVYYYVMPVVHALGDYMVITLTTE